MTSGDPCSKTSLLYCLRDRAYKSSFRSMGGKDNLFIASCDQKGLMGFNIALNYHVGRKPGLNVCVELCSLAENSIQGQFSDKACNHCSGSHSRKTGRDREAAITKAFSSVSESSLVMLHAC